MNSADTSWCFVDDGFYQISIFFKIYINSFNILISHKARREMRTCRAGGEVKYSRG